MVIYPFIHIGHCFVCSSSQYHSPSMSKIHSIPVLFEGSLVVNNGDICGGGSLFCSPFWESFVVWGSLILWSGIICGTVQYSTRGRQVWARNNDFGAGLADGLNQRFSFVCGTVIHWKLLPSTPHFSFLSLHCWTQLCSVCFVICFNCQY